MTKLLKMPFTLSGVVFADAVWDVVKVEASTEGVGLTAYVYSSPAAINAKQPLAGGFPQSVHLTYDEAYGDPQFTALVAAVKDAAWSVLRSHSSMRVGPAPAEGEPDERPNYFAAGDFIEV